MGSLPVWKSDRFAVRSDLAMFNRLNSELKSAWSDWEGPWTRMDPEAMRNSTALDMLDAWCGRVGKISLKTPEIIVPSGGEHDLIPNYLSFLRTIDHIGITNLSYSRGQWICGGERSVRH